ncbi:unnamed protein product [Onchocerca ochengi]|uniref:Pentatricopeptide repeat-containing protein n=1 Tax=Onchocerca ochengi TaxID=42157 RepID=A0A182EY55_ONCOC|nr:unnamed protein product [Onchocerca ochengi]
MAASLALSAHQRFKKSFKKTTRPIIKKNSSPAFPSAIATTITAQSATAANPLTPPNSDGSNYSTTPSPHDTQIAVHGGTTVVRGTTIAQAIVGHPENTVLHSSSVMLSPYSDHHNGIGCSPPQMVLFNYRFAFHWK